MGVGIFFIYKSTVINQLIKSRLETQGSRRHSNGEKRHRLMKNIVNISVTVRQKTAAGLSPQLVVMLL